MNFRAEYLLEVKQLPVNPIRKKLVTKMTDSDEATPLTFPFHQAQSMMPLIYSGINSAPVMHAKTWLYTVLCTVFMRISVTCVQWVDQCMCVCVCVYLPCHVFFCLHEADLMF